MTLSLWLVMMSAVLASLAAGVLVAYGCCLVMFRIFRTHALQVSERRRAIEEPQLVPQP